MKIIIIMGMSQYDASRHFLAHIGAALKTMGHYVEIWDLVKNSTFSPGDSPPDAILAINANGAEDIYPELAKRMDLSRTVTLWYLMDSPVYHDERLQVKVRNKVVLYIDESFSAFATDVLRHDIAADAFLPHAGVLYTGSPLQRDIEVLFTSSFFLPPERTFASRMGPAEAKFLSDAADYMLADKTNLPLWDGVAAVARAVGLDTRDWSHQTILGIVYELDFYLRARKKQQLLDFALSLGLNVHVYGNGWDAHPLADKLSGKQPVNFAETPRLNARAKLVLSSNCNFTAGTHDRVFTAMLNGALPIIDGSSYYDRQFPGLCLTVNDRERIEKLLADEDFFVQESTAARRIALRGHTWEHRAAALVRIIKDYRKHVLCVN